MKNMMNIFASKITDSFFFDLEVKPQIREQMRLGTYLKHEKSNLGWFGQPAST